jgi:DNA-binding transcriptional regulator GbsR (MarR family)
LIKKKRASPTEIAEVVGLSLQTICDTLRNLRNVDIVRYETINKNKVYFIKEKKIFDILDDIEDLVQRLRAKKW